MMDLLKKIWKNLTRIKSVTWSDDYVYRNAVDCRGVTFIATGAWTDVTSNRTHSVRYVFDSPRDITLEFGAETNADIIVKSPGEAFPSLREKVFVGSKSERLIQSFAQNCLEIEILPAEKGAPVNICNWFEIEKGATEWKEYRINSK